MARLANDPGLEFTSPHRLTHLAAQRRMIMDGGSVQGQSQQITQQSQQNSVEQQEQNAENKKQEDALKGFQQALQELP
jgi:hypothetical protein